MRKSKAIMIGAGIANMAAAVYLIQEGKWKGDQITFIHWMITVQMMVHRPTL